MPNAMAPADDMPLAVRRERRSNFGVRVKTEPDTLPDIKTPRRGGKKKVRFSDPGPTPTTGLTPMLNRTAIFGTPTSHRRGRRRASTPVTSHHRSTTPTSSSSSCKGQQVGTTSTPLRHVIDGRIERHHRRTALRTALDKLDTKHQQSAKEAKSQITKLRDELRARDREIYELQNATIIVDTDRICDLEQQVYGLQQQLRDAGAAAAQETSTPERSTVFNWTLAARDPFAEGDTSYMDLDHDDTNTEYHFGNETMAHFVTSTPSRTRHRSHNEESYDQSLISPPATSPIIQGMQTPSSGPRTKSIPNLPSLTTTAVTSTARTVPAADAGVQASLPDPEVLLRQVELESLQRESSKFAATLSSYEQLMQRLKQRLPQLDSAPHETAAPAETESSTNAVSHTQLEEQVGAVLASLSERTASLQKMTTMVSSLGFPGDDASGMLKSVADAFRSARLELEYLTPGECALPLSSCGAEVLSLILEQMRDLSRRVKEGEESIDEYHSIELNLRQQLDARVSVMDDLKKKLVELESLLGEKNSRIEELEVGNDRLKGAVKGYVRDMSELERLVESMEADGASKDSKITEKDDVIADLETRLKDATQRASELQDELEVAQASHRKHLDSVNRRSGGALAIRDARVTELRGEIDRVNGALRKAHDQVCRLRADSGSMREENDSLRGVVESMKSELKRVMRMSEELLDSNEEHVERSVEDRGDSDGHGMAGQYLNGKLARRSSGLKRRRHDSGLGFLDEEILDG